MISENVEFHIFQQAFRYIRQPSFFIHFLIVIGTVNLIRNCGPYTADMLLPKIHHQQMFIMRDMRF